MIRSASLRRGLNGLGFGLFVATGLSAWATILRVSQGTGPFDRIGSSYGITVLVYFLAFSLGGVIWGLLAPLRRWLLGSMLLGALLLAPMYLGFSILNRPSPELTTAWRTAASVIASLVAGGLLGVYVWVHERRNKR